MKHHKQKTSNKLKSSWPYINANIFIGKINPSQNISNK